MHKPLERILDVPIAITLGYVNYQNQLVFYTPTTDLEPMLERRSNVYCRYHPLEHSYTLERGFDMLIELELNSNDSEALLRHCVEYRPNTGDFREDSRLADALETLARAIKDAVEGQHQNDEAIVMIHPVLLEAAVGLFQEKALAINWLSKPVRALDGKRPLDVSVEEALTLIRRLEHGVFA